MFDRIKAWAARQTAAALIFVQSHPAQAALYGGGALLVLTLIIF